MDALKRSLPYLLYRVPAYLRLPVTEYLFKLVLALLCWRLLMLLLLLVGLCLFYLPVVVDCVIGVDEDGIGLGHGIWFRLISHFIGISVDHIDVYGVITLILVREVW